MLANKPITNLWHFQSMFASSTFRDFQAVNGVIVMNIIKNY